MSSQTNQSKNSKECQICEDIRPIDEMVNNICEDCDLLMCEVHAGCFKGMNQPIIKKKSHKI